MPNPPTAHRSSSSYIAIGWALMIVEFLIMLGVIIWMPEKQNYQESHNLWLASQPTLSLITSNLSYDSPTPLYFLFLHQIFRLGFLDITVVRLISILALIVALPVAYKVLLRATSNQTVAAFGIILMGSSPFMLWYSSRATMYSFLILFALINAYFYLGMLYEKKWNWLGYLISGFVALSLHYIFIVILLLQAIFYLFNAKHVRRKSVFIMLVITVIFLITTITWIVYSSGNSPAWNFLPFTAKPSPTNTFLVFVQFIFGFQSVSIITAIISLWPLLVVLALLSVQKFIKPPISIRYFVLIAFGSVLGMFIYSLFWKPLFLSSYLIIALPAFMFILAWYLVIYELRFLTFIRTALVITMFAMLILQLLDLQRTLTEDYLGLNSTTQNAPAVNIPKS